jgi:hypothetical protein
MTFLLKISDNVFLVVIRNFVGMIMVSAFFFSDSYGNIYK